MLQSVTEQLLRPPGKLRNVSRCIILQYCGGSVTFGYIFLTRTTTVSCHPRPATWATSTTPSRPPRPSTWPATLRRTYSIFSNIGSCILFFMPHIPYYVSTTHHSAMLLSLPSSNLVDRLWNCIPPPCNVDLETMPAFHQNYPAARTFSIIPLSHQVHPSLSGWLVTKLAQPITSLYTLCWCAELSAPSPYHVQHADQKLACAVLCLCLCVWHGHSDYYGFSHYQSGH